MITLKQNVGKAYIDELHFIYLPQIISFVQKCVFITAITEDHESVWVGISLLH